MSSGQTDLTSLTKQLPADADRTAYVRALLQRNGDGWTLHHVAVVVGIEPPGSTNATWEYEEAALIARTLPVASLITLSLEALAGRASLGEFEFAVPKPGSSVHWRHEPSSAKYDSMALAQPTMNYTFYAATPEASSWSPTMLVGASCPSFTDLNSAWRAFTEGNFSLLGAHNPPSDLAALRVAQTHGWIGRVRITPTELMAELHGDALDGCELELFSLSTRMSSRVEGPGVISFPLSENLPEQAWLWLKRGRTWLDYRVIDPSSPWASPSANVEFEPPVDEQASIEALLAAGEGQHVEFKREIVTGRKLKTVAAFASGDGGQVVFGMDRDEVTVFGIDGDPTEARDHLEQVIRAAIVPEPYTTVTIHTVEGKTILVLDVPTGEHELYGVIPRPDARDKPEYYIRRGANTYPAQPEQLARLLRSRQAQASSQDQHRAPWQ